MFRSFVNLFKGCEVDGRGALLALRRERNTLPGVSFLLLFSLRLLLAKKKVIVPKARPKQKQQALKNRLLLTC